MNAFEKWYRNHSVETIQGGVLFAAFVICSVSIIVSGMVFFTLAAIRWMFA